MKSAYELAMERLIKQSPEVKLTAAQKSRIAELDSKYKARVAEREIALKGAVAAAAAKGDFEEVESFNASSPTKRRSSPANWKKERSGSPGKDRG
jgi:hypothetical protein